MTKNEEARRMAVLRSRQEARIHELGGKVPPVWPWGRGDYFIRSLQLIEMIELLEAGKKDEAEAEYQSARRMEAFGA
jgi:hypothetical protein